MRLLALVALSCVLCVPASRAQEARDNLKAVSNKTEATPTQEACKDSAVVAGAPAASACGPAAKDCGRVWAAAEYLLWWTKGQHAPPLVTTSPAGTPAAQAGVLGQPGTTVLFGGPLNDGLRSGGRFSLGYWLDDCHECGIGGSFFMLQDSVEHFSINSIGDPIVVRPIFDVNGGVASAQITAFPGIAAGCLDITAFNRFLGADLFVRKPICCDCCDCCDPCRGQFEVLAGYRFLYLHDSLVINELVADLANAGTAFALSDSFRTTNQFHGVDVGVLWHKRSGRWSAEAMARLAVGATFQRTSIQGSTSIVAANAPAAVFPGGLLALSSNIGIYENTALSIVPELRLSVGYYLCENVRAFVGYNFLYWTNVVRAAEQIDLRINTNLLPPSVGGAPAFPAFLDRRNDFWAQGINFGVSINY